MYRQAQQASKYDDLSGLDDSFYTQHNASALALIERVVGRAHSYSELAAKQVQLHDLGDSYAILQIHGIAQSVRADVANGMLQQVRVLVHADMFTDFIEMAEHLLAEGYKDPAAVLLGGPLKAISATSPLFMA